MKPDVTLLNGKARIVIPGRPQTLNEVYGKHWRTRHKATAQTRLEGNYAALALNGRGYTFPPVASVVSWPTYTSRRSWPDVGAWMPAVKAVVDGLVDAGAWEDDDPTHVARLVFGAPTLGDADRLTIDIYPFIESDTP